MSLPQVCVCYLLRERDGRTEVLLGRKRHGLGAGYWVGLGGKLEPGEDAVDAAVRESFEEAGVVIDPGVLDARGRLTYLFPHREAWSQESSVFVCREWAGEPGPSDELDPAWFPLDAVPLDEMWDDASRWLPGVLAGGTVRRTFVFGPDLATVVHEHSPVA
ncbi:8-oxo-dGTP diphosphatase [Agromyces sp. MMS24-JH15]|uniref:8-oxo-dGTP diphosphatase n=1 Tax=Agromyces sp. MMS24-JH15 TaxID=3243765 RepID=UPI003748BE32